MRNVLSICLSVHWAVMFALSAAQAAGGASHGPGLAMLATGEMLVSVLFAWVALTALAGRTRPSCDVSDLLRPAVGLAGLVIAFGAVRAGMDGAGAPLSATALPMVALGVSYLVMRFEHGREDVSAGSAKGSRDAARVRAVAAAHGTVLARLARPGDNG